MAKLPTVFERKWPTIILAPITVANNVITVPSTVGLHVKQIVVLSLSGDQAEFEIKRVLSDTQLQVGPKDKNIATYSNPIQFNGGVLIMSEQERNSMGYDIALRAVYDEEPIVALRHVNVDKYGQYLDTVTDQAGVNRLAVDAAINLGNISVNISEPSLFDIIEAISPATPMTQFVIVVPANTRRFILKGVRGSQAQFDIARSVFSLNPPIYSVLPGDEFLSDNIKTLNPLALYIRTNKPNIKFELLYWY